MPALLQQHFYLLPIFAYLLGAVPFGALLVRLFRGKDVRQEGSGNIGATNVARTAGKGLGVLTLLLDAIKGGLPVVLAGPIWGLSVEKQALVGICAVLGHIFPVYLHFKGGKGVATAAGVFAALSPLSLGCALGVFIIVFSISRRVSLASMLAAVTLAGAAFGLDGRWPIYGTAILIALVVLIRHQANIRRLLRGEESQL